MITHIAFVHPDEDLDMTEAMKADGLAVVATPFCQRGKIYVMNRSSFIGPLIEETW